MALAFDVVHQCVEPVFIAASAQHGVVAIAGKALADRAANSGARTNNKADWFHGVSPALVFRGFTACQGR